MLEAGLTPGYVLDEMEFYEIDALLKNLHARHKASWEQARMICYVSAQANSTKALEPTDILKFPWDEVVTQPEDTTISTADIERLKEKTQQYLNEKACQQI